MTASLPLSLRLVRVFMLACGLAGATGAAFAQFGIVAAQPISATLNSKDFSSVSSTFQLPTGVNLATSIAVLALIDGEPVTDYLTFDSPDFGYPDVYSAESDHIAISASYNAATQQLSVHYYGSRSGTHTYSFQVRIHGRIYEADEGSSTIRVFDPHLNSELTLASSAVSGESASGHAAPRALSDALKNPKGVAVDANGNVFIADTGHNVIQELKPDGTLSVFAGSYGVFGTTDGTGTAASFAVPVGLAFDNTGNLYVADVGGNNIRKITPAGVVSTYVSGLSYAYSMVFDASNNLYVSNSDANQVLVVTPQGIASTYAGSGTAGSADGTGTAASFNFPCGLAFDAQGNLYVADDINNTIRKIAPGGVVTTLAGTAGITGSADGTGASAQFHYPFGIVIDGDGNLIVSDNGNHTLRQVTPAGVVTTVAGSAGNPGEVDGIGSAARLNSPYQLFVGDGVLQTNAATITFTSGPAIVGRLGNLSALTTAGGSAGVLTAGFTVGGTGTETVLARGIGPSLAAFNVSNVLPDPKIALFSTGGSSPIQIGGDAGWGGDSALALAFSATGAFVLPAASLDSALLTALSPGTYTVQIDSVGGNTGQALAELYEDDSAAPTARFINQSTLATAGSGSNTLTAGFVVLGSNPETILIRGVGPGLSPYNVSNVLPDPVLELHHNINGIDTVLQRNVGWSSDPILSQVFSSVGAFGLAANSADSAMCVTLLPGDYTAVLTSAGNHVGKALIEIYELPIQ